MRLRQSTLKDWMACPLQAKRKHIEGRPRRQNAAATFGTVVHHALEQLKLTGDLDRSINEFIDKWKNPHLLGVEPEVWPKRTSYGSYLSLGLDCLRSVAESDKWGKGQVVATEHRFLVPFGRHELEGTVDLLEIRKSGKGAELLVIEDYKTAYRQPTLAELALDIQFTVYDYASRQPEFWVGNGPEFPGVANGEWLFETLGDMPRRNVWLHVRTAREIDAGSRDQDDYDRLYRLIDEVEKAIERDVFVPRIGDPCGLCDYTRECGLTVPTREDISDEEAAWI